MTSPALAAVRGRPSITGLTASLNKARAVNVALREELRAHLRESASFAEEVRAHGMRVHYAAQADRPDLAAHEAAAIVGLRRPSAAADRPRAGMNRALVPSHTLVTLYELERRAYARRDLVALICLGQRISRALRAGL